jgi:lactoylglutathione lyase
MNLGAFSVSLTVKDLAASSAFYRTLGFEPFGGDGVHWQMLRNGDTVIGLFHGMFDRNVLTFNPGWNQRAEPCGPFTDVRELQRMLKERGVTLVTETDPAGAGPAHVALLDPDGNPVLIDQHVPRP